MLDTLNDIPPPKEEEDEDDDPTFYPHFKHEIYMNLIYDTTIYSKGGIQEPIGSFLKIDYDLMTY